ncbi:MAG: hypothetical protein QOD99_2484 [Chthoniobacter sp.]|jgi:hypothetical protein|nr:hypothetical protein [Chthoniobacter sp.]
MIPLGRGDFPTTREELNAALRVGLAVFESPRASVEIIGEFPALDRIAIDLSGGKLPLTPPHGGAVSAPFTANELQLFANPLRYEQAGIAVELRAQTVSLGFQRDENNQSLLAITGAREGNATFAIQRRELETLILAIASQAARAQGVSIERVDLKVQSTSQRSASFSCDVTAQKLFMKTVVTLSGAIEIDPALVARVSGLRCDGAGMIGGLACGFLRPYLARFEGQTVPLASFALGELRVVDVTLETGEELRVTAHFGAT